MMIVIKQFRVKWNQEGRKRIGWAREGDKGEMRKKKRERRIEEEERKIEGEKNNPFFLLGLHLNAISKYLVSEWNPGSCPNRDSGPQILILESAASLLVENVHFRLLLHVASTIC